MSIKLRVLLIPFIALFLFPLRTAPALADQTQDSSVSLSDEVYADLALNHELGKVSVYFFQDKPSTVVAIDDQKPWLPASTIKLYVGMYTFDQISRGKLTLSQSIQIEDNNVAPSLSFLNGYSPLLAGQTVTLYRLLDQMITQSDNTAFNQLLDLLDRREVTKYVHDLGLVNSSVGSKLNLDDVRQGYDTTTPGYGINTTTANDYATAFILINGGRIPGSSSLFDTLARQKSNNMIPFYLPKGITIAHKTGELDPFYHDGGIIESPNQKYIVSIFSETGDPGTVAHLSQLIYTRDANLVGSLSPSRSISYASEQAVDPMVLSQNDSESEAVLGVASPPTRPPRITASDLGVTLSDVTPSYVPTQLPSLLFGNSRYTRWLSSLGQKLFIATLPIPSLRHGVEVNFMKYELAEANDLLKKGDVSEARNVLSQVNSDIGQIAKDTSLKADYNTQRDVNTISETRFAYLKDALSSSRQADKTQLIKEIASTARTTVTQVYPAIKNAINSTSLSQQPAVGEIIGRTNASITVRTSSGDQTISVHREVKTRSQNSTTDVVGTPLDLSLGQTVAVTPSFIMTKVSTTSANPAPLRVVKVNTKNGTLIVNDNGSLTQVDITPSTIVKGADTTVSIDQIHPGDLVIVHSIPVLPPTNAAISTPSPSLTPIATSGSGPGTKSSPPTGSVNLPPQGSAAPSSIPAASLPASSPALAKETPAPTSKSTPASKPIVVVGSVIKVVEQSPTGTKGKKQTPTPKQQTDTSMPPPPPTTKKNEPTSSPK